MRLKKILRLQLTYCGLGILFNLVSWIVMIASSKPLTPTLPWLRIIIMSWYGVFLLTGFYKKIRWYKFLMLISIILLGYGGILKHISALHTAPELYYSILAGVIAIGINIFGWVLNVMACFSKIEV